MEFTDVLKFAGTTELNNAVSSDIYFQDSLDYTASLSDRYIDDVELGKLLAIVVDRTGQPESERSDSDHFRCSVRNVKSAQNQFPVITQAHHRTRFWVFLSDSSVSLFTKPTKPTHVREPQGNWSVKI